MRARARARVRHEHDGPCVDVVLRRGENGHLGTIDTGHWEAHLVQVRG